MRGAAKLFNETCDFDFAVQYFGRDPKQLKEKKNRQKLKTQLFRAKLTPKLHFLQSSGLHHLLRLRDDPMEKIHLGSSKRYSDSSRIFIHSSFLNSSFAFAASLSYVGSPFNFLLPGVLVRLASSTGTLFEGDQKTKDSLEVPSWSIRHQLDKTQ